MADTVASFSTCVKSVLDGFHQRKRRRKQEVSSVRRGWVQHDWQTWLPLLQRVPSLCLMVQKMSYVGCVWGQTCLPCFHCTTRTATVFLCGLTQVEKEATMSAIHAGSCTSIPKEKAQFITNHTPKISVGQKAQQVLHVYRAL